MIKTTMIKTNINVYSYYVCLKLSPYQIKYINIFRLLYNCLLYITVGKDFEFTGFTVSSNNGFLYSHTH